MNEQSTMQERPVLSMLFGKDQSFYVDKILNTFKDKGRIITYIREARPEQMVAYQITFKTLYDIYLFGHEQASWMTSHKRFGILGDDPLSFI